MGDSGGADNHHWPSSWVKKWKIYIFRLNTACPAAIQRKKKKKSCSNSKLLADQFHTLALWLQLIDLLLLCKTMLERHLRSHRLSPLPYTRVSNVGARFWQEGWMFGMETMLFLILLNLFFYLAGPKHARPDAPHSPLRKLQQASVARLNLCPCREKGV